MKRKKTDVFDTETFHLVPPKRESLAHRYKKESKAASKLRKKINLPKKWNSVKLENIQDHLLNPDSNMPLNYRKKSLALTTNQTHTSN